MGYRFDGPVAYSDGQVSLCSTNGGTTGYRIVEKKTTWDSQAVLDNYVTTKAQGLRYHRLIWHDDLHLRWQCRLGQQWHALHYPR